MIYSLIHRYPTFVGATRNLKCASTSLNGPSTIFKRHFEYAMSPFDVSPRKKDRFWQYIGGSAALVFGYVFYLYEKNKVTLPFPKNIGVRPIKTLMSGDFMACYYSPVPDQIFKKMQGKSYKTGCPLLQSDLAYVRVRHIGMDGKIHRGELVVHNKIAPVTLEIFKDIFAAKFPINKMTLIDVYDADDDRSMEDNNTSAFCYRRIAHRPDEFSNHALGIAIDINPLLNPFVKERLVAPKNGAKYTDRTLKEPGMIHPDSAVVTAFTKHGFNWGGDWRTLKDYQHFEINIIKAEILKELESRKKSS